MDEANRDNTREAHLLARLRQGDDTAFEALMTMHRSRAVAVAYGMVNNPVDARELAQEAFVKTYFAMDSFDGSCRFFTWFYRILINVCRDHQRRAARAWVIPFSRLAPGSEEWDMIEHIQQNTADKRQPTAFEQLAGRETSDTVRQALDQLSAMQRKVFVMRHQRGLSIQEIAECTACAPGTVKSHLTRAREKVRGVLRQKMAMYKDAETVL